MTDWTPLNEELALWRANGQKFPLWWRDDDATDVTPALERLHGLSDSLGLPVHLAVIPEPATDTLAEWIAQRRDMIPVVHGWSHTNNAPPDQKKAEFGDHRPLEEMMAEITRGRARLSALFPDRLANMFVPPWNRTCEGVIKALAGCGFAMISTFTPRQARLAAPGLVRVNTHLDPINWRNAGALVAPDGLVAQVADDLAARRLGQTDNAEPYGLLTHHLVHDEPIWEFVTALAGRLMDGPATPWRADIPANYPKGQRS